MRHVLCTTLLLMLAVVMPGSAQILGTGVIPVTEIGPTAFNAEVTAIQSTATAINAVLQSGYQLLEITPLDEIALSDEFWETMTTLQAIAQEGSALMQDAEAAKADFEFLFSLDEPDATPAALQLRLACTMAALHKARVYAIRTQSLIQHISGAVTHVRRLVELLSALFGNMASNQVQIQLLAQANQTLQAQTLQQAADQRVRIMEQAQREIMVAGWNRIQAHRWDGWPTASGGE